MCSYSRPSFCQPSPAVLGGEEVQFEMVIDPSQGHTETNNHACMRALSNVEP